MNKITNTNFYHCLKLRLINKIPTGKKLVLKVNILLLRFYI